MCKKLVVVAVAVVLGLVIVKHSLFQAWWKDQKDPVSLDLRIKQLKVEVDKIPVDIVKARDVKVKLRADVKELTDQETLVAARFAKVEKEFVALHAQVKAEPTRVSKDASDELVARYESKQDQFKSVRNELDSIRLALKKKTESLNALVAQMTKMENRQRELQAMVTELEAMHQQLKLKQLENNTTQDDTQLRVCEDLAKQIKRRLLEEDIRAEEFASQPVKAQAPRKSREELLKSGEDLLNPGKAEEDAPKN